MVTIQNNSWFLLSRREGETKWLDPHVRAVALGCLFLLFDCFASSASACNIPVFRYAFERWQSDDYEVIVYHDETAGDVDSRFRSKIETAGVNAKLVLRDFAQMSPPHRALMKSEAGRSIQSHPRFIVQGPRRDSAAFHVPVKEGSIDHVLDSPARKELSRRLLSGHAIVWLLVRSSDESNNEQARQRLIRSIESVAGKIELPEGIGLPGSELHSEVPLLLRFSVLEIDPDNPDESFLGEMFFGYDRDDKEPLVLPVFGRGRALEVIPAGQLTESLIESLTVYLCGACSCQAKERNPGFDLLIATDWERELFGDQPPPRDEPLHAQRRQGNQPPSLLEIPPGKSSKP